MMPPGSRASLADGFVSPAMTFGQAFWFCLPRVRRMLAAVGAKTAYIEPGSPWENGYCESFNSKLRD